MFRSSIKSGIPRASFRTQQRSSLYTKAIPNKQLRNDKATFSPNINGTYIGRSSVVVPKPSVITNSPSVKNAERLQGIVAYKYFTRLNSCIFNIFCV